MVGEVVCQRGLCHEHWRPPGNLGDPEGGRLLALGERQAKGKQLGGGRGSRQGQVTTGVGSARKTSLLGRGLDG